MRVCEGNTDCEKLIVLLRRSDIFWFYLFLKNADTGQLDEVINNSDTISNEQFYNFRNNLINEPLIKDEIKNQKTAN